MSDVRIFGGKEWERLLRRLGDAANMKVNIGILEGSTYASDAEPKKVMPTVPQVAYWHEFGRGRNPERSFLRRGLAEHGAEWNDSIQSLFKSRMEQALRDPRNTVRGILQVVGQIAVDDVKGYINNSMLAPLTAARVKQKIRRGQSSNASIPLAFTGALVEAIKSEVKDG
jgi:hypothetical protein